MMIKSKATFRLPTVRNGKIPRGGAEARKRREIQEQKLPVCHFQPKMTLIYSLI